MPNQRVQVADLSAPERLRPSAAPSQSYVAPKQDTSAAEFMKSLATLNPALDGLADKLAADERDKQEAAVQGKIGGMTFDEFKTARAKDPMLGFTGKWARAALDKQYGTRLGHEVRRQAEEEMATADLTATNPEDFLAKHTEAAMQELGDNKFARAGFDAVTAGLGDKVRDAVNTDRIKRTVETRTDNARENFLGTIEWAQSELADPDAVVHVIRQQYQQNRDLLGMSYGDQDKIMADVAKTLAQRPGNEKVIEAIGALDRDGVRLSTKLGATWETLKDSAKAETLKADNEGLQADMEKWLLASGTGDAAQFSEKEFTAWADQHPSVQGHTRAAIIERFRNEQEQAARRAQAALEAGAKDNALISATPHLVELARQGHIAEISEDVEFTTPGGKKITMTKQELRERGLQQAARQIEQEGEAQGLSPLQVRQNVIANYGKNGEKDPLTDSRVSAFLNAAAGDGDVPQTMLDYLPELLAAKQVAPHMVDQIAGNDDNRRFLEALATGTEYGLDPRQALANAKYRRDNPMPVMGGKERSTAVDQVLQSFRNQNKLFGQIGFGQTVHDRAGVERVIGQRLEYYHATGAVGSDLTKKVLESINRTHAYMGGRLVDISGTGLPASQTLPIFKDAADALKEAQPALAKQDITFMPLGRGSTRFQAVTATGIPIPGTQRDWTEMQDLASRRKQTRLQHQGERARDLRNLRTEYWAGEHAGEGAPGSMIGPIH